MTRKEMYQRVECIAELLGFIASEEEAKKNNQDEFLTIDIANGGYMLVWRKVKTGGERGFYGNGRMTNKDFDNYTNGIRDTLYMQDYMRRMAEHKSKMFS